MSVFEPVLLPDSEKEHLCRQLLEEFGADRVTKHRDELIHGCLVSDAHQDQRANPTASLNYSKLVWKCLGCGASGGLLWFIATMRKCSSQEARQWLQQATGTGGEAMDLGDLLRYFDALYAEKNVRTPIPRYNTRVLGGWELDTDYATPVRGIAPETVERYGIRHAPRYELDDKGRTSDRLVIPHFWKGELVGWHTRRLTEDGTPKYLNSPDFPKDQTVFNYQPGGPAVVVEAPLSALKHAHALPMEATFGASVTDRQIALLADHERIYLFMDNDEAGWKSVEGYDHLVKRRREHVEGVAEKLARYTVVMVVDNPFKADPGDLDTDMVQALVETAVPWNEWQRPQTLVTF